MYDGPLARLKAIMEFAEIIKSKRKEKGLTLESLAHLAGVTYKTVFALEHGNPVTVTTLVAVCKALQLKLTIEDK